MEMSRAIKELISVPTRKAKSPKLTPHRVPGLPDQETEAELAQSRERGDHQRKENGHQEDHQAEACEIEKFAKRGFRNAPFILHRYFGARYRNRNICDGMIHGFFPIHFFLFAWTGEEIERQGGKQIPPCPLPYFMIGISL